MTTRREFHGTLLALAAAALAGRGAAQDAPPRDPDRVFLDRLTFGATAADLAELKALGRSGWLDAQIALAEDPELDTRLAAMRVLLLVGPGEMGPDSEGTNQLVPLTSAGLGGPVLADLVDGTKPLPWAWRVRPAVEVIVASLTRAVHARAQLREMMTQFWHDHFNVNALTDEITGAFFARYDAVLRQHALGNFRDLLGAVAREPAMLHYLTNDNSRASPANENFARELFELHTLGAGAYLNAEIERWDAVPGAAEGRPEGWIDDDVYEAARAFTGWTIGDGRRWDEGALAPRSGAFEYAAVWHDPYQKRVLGRELPAFAAPLADGEAVLDLVAAHPATARFVAGKILRRIGLETPSETCLADVAAVFAAMRGAPDQIALTLRAAALHPEFAATPPAKLRRPFEYLAALYRATGAGISPQDDGLYWQLGRSGWTQHQVRPPTGHSDDSADWASTRTLSGMVELALNGHAPWWNAVDDVLRRRPPGVVTWGDLADHWDARLTPGGRDVLATLAIAPAERLDGSSDADVEWVTGHIVAAAALTPLFLFR